MFLAQHLTVLERAEGRSPVAPAGPTAGAAPWGASTGGGDTVDLSPFHAKFKVWEDGPGRIACLPTMLLNVLYSYIARASRTLAVALMGFVAACSQLPPGEEQSVSVRAERVGLEEATAMVRALMFEETPAMNESVETPVWEFSSWTPEAQLGVIEVELDGSRLLPRIELAPLSEEHARAVRVPRPEGSADDG